MNQSRPGLFGKSVRPFLVFVFEILARRPVMIMHECTVDFPHAVWADFLGDSYTITYMILCPTKLGYPVRRPRLSRAYTLIKHICV